MEMLESNIKLILDFFTLKSKYTHTFSFLFYYKEKNIYQSHICSQKALKSRISVLHSCHENE